MTVVCGCGRPYKRLIFNIWSGQRDGVRGVRVRFARVQGGRTVATSVRGVRNCNTDVKFSEPLIECPCENV